MQRVKEKKERALGMKLFLKAERCSSHKCAFIRKPYPPGMHGQKRKVALSDYGRQLKEKQKMQILYGLKNKQMVNLFRNYKAEEIISILERRLDRTVFYLGFAPSLRMARQIVSHGHILVNGRKTKTPSIVLQKGDKVAIREESKNKKVFADLNERLKQKEIPTWLKLDKEKLEGEVISMPNIEEKQVPFDISLIAEFYAR